MKDGVGFLQELSGLESQEIGIAGTGANDMGNAGRTGLATRGI